MAKAAGMPGGGLCPANIAEGNARGALRDYIRFLEMARGSLSETEYYLSFLTNTKLLAKGDGARLGELCDQAGKLLYGLIVSLSEKLKKGEWNRHSMFGVKEEQEAYQREPAEE